MPSFSSGVAYLLLCVSEFGGCGEEEES